jgi:hypothetical protein
MAALSGIAGSVGKMPQAFSAAVAIVAVLLEWLLLWDAEEICDTLLRTGGSPREDSQGPWVPLHLTTSPNFSGPGDRGMNLPSNA